MTMQTASGTTLTTLPDLADNGYDQRMIVKISYLVNFGLPGVRQDVGRWLSWMLAGGSRPRPTARAVNANGVNAYQAVQNVVCATLDHFGALIDWASASHFKLVERATRPSPGTTPLVDLTKVAETN